MRFDNSQSLANHVKKFCTGSVYGDVNKLEQRLQQLGSKPLLPNNQNLNFQDVRNYLKGENVNPDAQKSLAAMNLDDLRNYFQSENLSYEELQKQALRTKERHLIEEIEDFKREKQQIRLARIEQDRNMNDLMQELSQKRDREIRAKAEKQEIQRALQEVERNKVTALERDKRRELERLAAERENLRLREEQLLEEIRQMEANAAENENIFRAESQVMPNGESLIASKETGRIREIELARDRGEHIAHLQMKRDLLEKDRIKIMEDLEKIKQGDMTALRRNEASRWAANDILQRNPTNMAVDISKIKLDPVIKDKLLADQLRIKQLKEQREKTLMEQMVPEVTLDFSRNDHHQRNQSTYQNHPSSLPAGPVTIATPLKQSPTKTARPIEQQKQIRFEETKSGNPMLDKLRQLREDYERSGTQEDPEFYNYIADLENHLMGKGPVQTKPLPLVNNLVNQQKPQILDQPKSLNQPAYPNPPLPILPAPYQFSLPPPPTMIPQYQPPILPKVDLSSIIQQKALQPEPLAQPAQQYYKKNQEVEEMNKLLQEHASQTEILERELHNLKNGAITFEQFEKLLQDQPAGLQGPKRKRVGGAPLPEDFRFRQNDYRAEDMEVEERALMNIAAQEFDQLRILSKIPKNSEIYKHKMEQYKEMSAMRAEMEKMLQEQKLEKIRREFERAKIEDQRRFQHEQWLEEQQKNILEAKLTSAAMQIPNEEIPYDQQQLSPQYMNPYQEMNIYDQQAPNVNRFAAVQDSFSRQNSVGFQEQQLPQPEIKVHRPLQRDAGVGKTPLQSQMQQRQQQQEFTPQRQNLQSMRSNRNDIGDTNSYNPVKGFNIYFDFIARLQKQYRSMRLVYAVYNVSRAIVTPTLIDIHDFEPDPEDPDEKNRIIFKEFATLRNIQAHPSSNLIIEAQVPKPNTGASNKFVSYGWTVLNLFDLQYNFNRGIYKLPFYQSPTRADIDIRDLSKQQRIQETVLLFRIGNPDDQFSRFQMNALTTPEDYNVPRIHQIQNSASFGGMLNTQLETANVQDSAAIINPEVRCKGMSAYVHFIKHYVPPNPSRIQLTLYEGSNIVRVDDGKMCNWASRPFDSQNLLFTEPTNPMSRGLGITPQELQRGELISVDDETTWLKDFYRMQFDPQSGSKQQGSDLHLVIQIMESKYPRGDPRPADYQAIAYGVLQINNFDGTLNYGTHDVPMFRPPINLVKRNPSDLVKQIAKITIGQPNIVQQQQPQLPQDPNRLQVPPSNRGEQQQQYQQKTQNDLIQKPNSLFNRPDSPFIQNDRPQFQDLPFREREGIDIYIDGARFLPENATFTRVVMRGYTIDQVRVINPVKSSCDLGASTARNPFFGFRYELRSAVQFDPTIVIEATLETIDRSDGQDKIIGYSYFPLFLSQMTKKQNIDKNNTSFILQNGCYQLPIYFDKFPVTKNLTIENLQLLEKIPCASVLLRCFRAPQENGRVLGLQDVQMQDWKAKRVIVDPPDYSEGIYNTQYCRPTSLEMELYKVKADRNDPSMRQVAQYVERMKGEQPHFDDDQLAQWLDRVLNTNQSTPRINMSYFSAYHPSIGFKFSVERLHGLTHKLPHIVVTSIAPPASIYSAQPRRTPDVNIFSQFNLDNFWNSLQFNDDYIAYTGLQMTVKLGFILDVKAVQAGGSSSTVTLLDIGWAFLPIYNVLANEDNTMSIYINSGLHSLPIFPGSVPKDIMSLISQNQQNIIELLKPEQNNKVIEGASVIVRIHDNQREVVPPKGSNYNELITKYLPQDRLQQFKFVPDSKNNLPATGADAIKSVIPSSLQNKDTFKTACNNALKEKYGI